MSIMLIALLAAQTTVLAEERPQAPSVVLTVDQMFAFADARRDSGDFSAAEAAYRALASHPDLELRTEARFRLGLMLADRMARPRDAAVEFRRILDEKPGAARVRLELARVQAQLGRLGDARRELRAAQAAGLPPEVERMVRFYAAALRANKPFGGSLEVALAPDSNINRATRSDTLGTVLGNFTLNEDARAKSGLGLAMKGQVYARIPAGRAVSVLLRANGSADLYPDPQFHDVLAGFQAGPEFALGKDRLSVAVGPTWRWYGAQPYSTTVAASANFVHPLGTKAQLRLDGTAAHTTNRRNALQTANVFAASIGYDRAFSARFGGGLQASANRTAAGDRGWSDVTAGFSAYAFREIGRTTAVLSLGYSHLEADGRLSLYPRRRVDDRLSITASTTWRALQWKGLAPITRLRWERNRSTVGIYDYRRIGGEIGITTAF